MKLSNAQWATLNAAILALYSPYRLDQLPERFLEAVRSVVPGDLTHISLTHPQAGGIDAFLDQPGHDALANLAAHRDDLLNMPGFRDGSFYLAAEDRPVSYLDFMDRKRLEATALWEFLCRPLDLEWDLSVNFHRSADLFFTISTSRGSRRHDAGERAVLAMLQPHLRRRFALAAMAEPEHPLLHTTEKGGYAPVGHIVCDGSGRILFASEETLAKLRKAGVSHGGKLPEAWLSWIEHNTRPDAPRATSLDVRGKCRELRLHHLGDSKTGEHHLLVGLARELPVQLTAREKEIAHWLAQGKTNREIATILALSASTVKHHVASILDKLMAENRTAAAVRLRSMTW
ncbi:MAG: helix-turn-helix transcriptional regulator [Rhizobiaceae bacterium]|nr:helix-turn-helix transcriptional regulator [Rhizobiaceae bacterium]